MDESKKNNSNNQLSICPNCKNNKDVVVIDEDIDTMAQLFILKPLDTHYCRKCNKGF